jgi:transcriptional regulator of met regulon
MRFFTGLHHPADARHFDAAFVSVNAIRKRKSDFPVGGDWILDSGAFSEISRFGHYRSSVAEYAAQIRRWKTNGNLLAAVAQDYMCEPFIVAKTGLSVAEHQRLTIERYDELIAEDVGVYVMPVLQGYAPEEYVAHLDVYGDRIGPGAWVGVGSVCKRNGDPKAIARVLHGIKTRRPDLRLHGFGLKTTSLADPLVRSLLHTADSMGWSYAARIKGRNGNDWREAKAWALKITSRPVQTLFDFIPKAA